MRKYFIIVAITATAVLFLNAGLAFSYEKEIKAISTALAENIAKSGKRMIAVVDFTDLQGDVTEFGRFLAEEFSVAFAMSGKGFEVMDRTHLKTILAEHKLTSTGMIDPQTAKKLGQISGVDALITGSITPFGNIIRLSVKVLDTSTARVIGAANGDIAKTKAIEDLLEKNIRPQKSVVKDPSSDSGQGNKKSDSKHSIISAQSNEFLFEGMYCKRIASNLECNFRVTNLSPYDASMTIYSDHGTHQSSLYNNQGYQFRALKENFGRNSYVSQDLSSKLPTVFKIAFLNIPQSDKIVSVRICYTYNPGADKHQVRGDFLANIRQFAAPSKGGRGSSTRTEYVVLRNMEVID